MKSRKKTKKKLVKTQLYWIKNDGKLCVLCGSELGSCHVGDYCTGKNCTYVDGTARLTKRQANKFKDFIELVDFKQVI